MIPQEDLENLNELLYSDLETLFKLVFTYKNPLSEGDIRLASAILRKWISEGLIGKLCNQLNVTATFPVLDNEQVLNEIIQQPSINYFVTAGVKFNGKPVIGIYNSNAPLSAPLSFKTIKTTFLKTAKFSKQRRVYFKGSFFSCEDIIQFTANKLGGVHFDIKYKDKQILLEQASKFMTFGGPIDKLTRPPSSELHLALEPNSSEILSCLHLEIIAAATSLLSVRFNDSPLFEFHPNMSPWDKFKKIFGSKSPFANLYESDKQPQ